MSKKGSSGSKRSSDSKDSKLKESNKEIFEGAIVSLTLEDPALIENGFMKTSLIRWIAEGFQFNRVNARMRVEDMQANAKARMDTNDPEGGSNTTPDSDGSIQGLSDAQMMFMVQLEDQIDMANVAIKDCERLWGRTNIDPALKLFRFTDEQRKQQIVSSAAKKNTNNKFCSLAVMRKFLNESRAARQRHIEDNID